MKPDRIVLFGYAHVPWMAKNQRMIDEAALPGAEERAMQSRSSAQELIAGGYVPIGIDHFALPEDSLTKAMQAGKLHRNFQGYTDDDARSLIGFGVTSIGRTPFGYLQNQSETGAWARAIEAGHLPVSKGLVMSLDDCLRAYVIERIMCVGTIDLEIAGGFFDAEPNWYEPEIEQLEILTRDGLITREGARITLTPSGIGLARVVAATFDSYLRHDRARHSVAV
jgi:oxygen-independent coproporphyrinogen-3 oxidase